MMKSRQRKRCFFCFHRLPGVDYKAVDILRRFITETSKMVPRRITGTCAYHQRMLSKTIKLSRFLALLPYCDRHR